jgi:four helix bundle protein
MGKEEWLEYKKQLRERLRRFALNILKLSEQLPDHTRGRTVNNQITKSGTSMYANYRAALRGRSKREFFSKLSIVVEEADETEMWLDLIIDSKILVNELIIEMHKESFELVRILASMRKKLMSRERINMRVDGEAG